MGNGGPAEIPRNQTEFLFAICAYFCFFFLLLLLLFFPFFWTWNGTATLICLFLNLDGHVLVTNIAFHDSMFLMNFIIMNGKKVFFFFFETLEWKLLRMEAREQKERFARLNWKIIYSLEVHFVPFLSGFVLMCPPIIHQHYDWCQPILQRI